MKRFASLLSICAMLAVPAAMAQTPLDLSFPQADGRATLSGSLDSGEHKDYRIEARAGQEMFYRLNGKGTDPKGVVVLDLKPPGGSARALYLGARDIDRWEIVRLPRTGTYTLRIYVMDDDDAGGGSVGFNIDLLVR